MSLQPFVIQVIGTSGAGKTLVVERAVRRLVARRLSVAVVKHSHHRPDLRGKDTDRFRRAGASLVLFAGPSSFLSFDGDPADLIPVLPVDVVLVEGYSRRRVGGVRLVVHSPEEAPGLVARIVASAPSRRGSPTLVADGRRRSADRLWRLVLNVMERRGVRALSRDRT